MRSAALLLAASGCFSHLSVTTRATVAIDEAAPPFALPDQDGKTLALADALAHGPVVLVFYRGYW